MPVSTFAIIQDHNPNWIDKLFALRKELDYDIGFSGVLLCTEEYELYSNFLTTVVANMKSDLAVQMQMIDLDGKKSPLQEALEFCQNKLSYAEVFSKPNSADEQCMTK